MNEFSNEWTLYQYAGGRVEGSTTVSVGDIVPNQAYEMIIRYDGDTFYGSVDGVEIVALDRDPDTEPGGYAGFMINNSNAEFTELRVTGTFEDIDLLFAHSFEPVEEIEVSQCTQE